MTKNLSKTDTPSRIPVGERRALLLHLAILVSLAAVLGRPTSVLAGDMSEDVLNRVKKAALYVKTFESERERADKLRGTGTGFFVNRTGLLITNNHVVDPSHGKSPIEKFRENYQGGKLVWKIVVDSGTDEEKEYEATVLYQNEAADQAVLQAFDDDGNMLKPPSYLRLLPESRLRKYLETWSFGFPGGDRQADRGKKPKVQIDKGNIIDIPRTPGGRIRMIYTDALVRPGNSGGPCVDQDGFVVGTVTLMKPPEGREDTGGARYSALVPAKLSGEAIRNASLLGKVSEGTDLTPFVESMTEEGGLVNISAFERREQDDVLYFDNGDRYPGSIKAESIAWTSDLASLAIPCRNIAYLMRNDDGFNLVLEGGNRLAGKPADDSIDFETRGGKAVKVSLKDVSVIAFRMRDHRIDMKPVETIVFDSNIGHLVFDEVQGEATIDSRLGEWELELRNIDVIETNDAGDQVISLTDGSRLTGTFKSRTVRGKLAGLDLWLDLDLSKVERGLVERRAAAHTRLGGLGLAALLKDAEPAIREAYELLEEDPPKAAKLIADLAGAGSGSNYAQVDRDRVRLLETIIQLRKGNYRDGIRGFRSVTRSQDLNLAALAGAYAEVLRKHENGKFDGKPLSDVPVFTLAGRQLAGEFVREARSFLKTAHPPKIEKKGDFTSLLSKARRHEKHMEVAAVMHGTEAEDLMIRIWKVVIEAGVQEYERLVGEDPEGQSRRGGRRDARRRKQLIEGNERLAKVVEAVREYVIKKYDYGFHIEDPDIADIMARRD